ncbi:YcaO-like family protein [Herbidospora daliensis]|uniref:YcaO-like family protein n=1 Tax=Herbidospora daliensis TaxID=295585 RepID=UPI0007827E6C|nr:YcaO-like family protein [Herbidospora daliensis]
MDALLDPRTGPVTRLETGRSHAVLHTATAELAATGRFAHPLGNPLTGGASFGDPARARLRALGEAAERYAGHLVPADLRRATWHDLDAAVDPDRLALYSPEQHARPGFPFAGLRRDDVLSWTPGRTGDGKRVWVPASLVWLPAGEHSLVRGRPAHLPIAAGIAAGPTLEAARASALAEVLERHALATAWHGGAAFPLADGPPLPAPAGAELTWRSVPNRPGAPVVLCAAVTPDGLVGVGCATGSARSAAAEALRSLDALAEVAAGVPEWERPAGPLRPHRADRRYLDSYAPDLGDATDVLCTLQLLADARVASAVRDRLAGGVPSGTPSAAPDLDVITVDLTPPDLAEVGVRVARVVVPGLRSTGPAAYPFLGAGLDPLPGRVERLPVPHV